MSLAQRRVHQAHARQPPNASKTIVKHSNGTARSERCKLLKERSRCGRLHCHEPSGLCHNWALAEHRNHRGRWSALQQTPRIQPMYRRASAPSPDCIDRLCELRHALRPQGHPLRSKGGFNTGCDTRCCGCVCVTQTLAVV